MSASKMRTFIAALTIALLPVAAHAQSNPSLATSRGQRAGYDSYKEWKPRYQKEMDELHRDKSYQDVLKTIPDVKKPWRDAR